MAMSHQHALGHGYDLFSELPWQDTGRTAKRGIFVVAAATAVPILLWLMGLLKFTGNWSW